MGVHESKVVVRTTEKEFKQRVQKDLKSKGAFVYLTIEAFKSGVPDLFFAINGHSIWVELKWIQDGERLDHEVSLQQSKFLADCNKAGGVGYVLVGRASDQSMFALKPEKVEKVNSIANMTKIEELDELWESLQKVQPSPTTNK